MVRNYCDHTKKNIYIASMYLENKTLVRSLCRGVLIHTTVCIKIGSDSSPTAREYTTSP